MLAARQQRQQDGWLNIADGHEAPPEPMGRSESTGLLSGTTLSTISMGGWQTGYGRAGSGNFLEK
ncbi:hypothetical protein Rhe02_18590 [Rhizocola hellebori]|uniref:Uncharacterized protein n=1 Tax=Rhizocola hellebori TaxID=1392758 RepID=A0A8J3VF50_9ACTN|nr:hypothetical protein Rhe02_18590 [Rhizocola hellebori]